jgi:hypothetical protein
VRMSFYTDLFGWNNALQGQMRPKLRRYCSPTIIIIIIIIVLIIIIIIYYLLMEWGRGHTCVRYDNFMIVYGGYSGRPLSDMWVLDTSTTPSDTIYLLFIYLLFIILTHMLVSVRWSRFPTPAGSKHPGKRSGHVSVVIGDRMWMFGYYFICYLLFVICYLFISYYYLFIYYFLMRSFGTAARPRTTNA